MVVVVPYVPRVDQTSRRGGDCHCRRRRRLTTCSRSHFGCCSFKLGTCMDSSHVGRQKGQRIS
jgi:hypothetical protein